MQDPMVSNVKNGVSSCQWWTRVRGPSRLKKGPYSTIRDMRLWSSPGRGMWATVLCISLCGIRGYD